MNFRLAAKAFVVTSAGRCLLLIKRRQNDVHKPGVWDLPGGRLEPGEDPIVGLKREAKEEIGCEIDVFIPFDVHHFKRDDGQQITMMVFLSRMRCGESIKLSEEHTEHRWIDLWDEKDRVYLPDWLKPTLENYKWIEKMRV